MYFPSKNKEKKSNQIRMKYSWTKKNFGMDRDVVADSIIRNCKREDCLKSMRMEMARLSTSLCSNALNPQLPEPESFSEMTFGMPAALSCLSPYTYRWPFALPVPPMFPPPGDFPIQFPVFANMYNIGNPLTACNHTLGFNPMVDPRGCVPQPGAAVHKTEVDSNRETPVPEEVSPRNVGAIQTTAKVELGSPSVTLRFRKPKNVHEYRSLMEAAQGRPAEFPDILNKEKTRFLSILGIAPKSVCSTRTLRKFRRELRHKLLMNRECMIYRERKFLRDKNKLRKFSHGKPKRQFLGMGSTRKDLSPTNLGKSRSDAATSKVKVAKKSNCEQNDSNRKRMRVSSAEKVEVIDIISSDEESQRENISKYESCAVSEPQHQSNGLSNNSTSEPTGKTFDVKYMKIAEGNHAENAKNKIISHDKSENLKDGESLNAENDKNASSEDRNSSDKHPAGTGSKPFLINYQAQKIENLLNAKPLLLPKVMRHIPILSKSRNPSNIPLEPKSIQTPKFLVSSNASRMNVNPKCSTNYLFPSVNAAPIVIRPITPSNVQQTLVVSDPNSVTRIVYPLPASQSQTNNVKLLLRDKDQKEALYVTHRYSRSILPQIQPRSESQVNSDPEMSKMADPIPSITSQLQQLKQMKAERERILLDQMYNQDKSKIDLNQEMSRIAKWIYRLKANLNPNMFQHGIEKSVHKLISQLDIGICLVREAKKSLTEIENSLGAEMPSAKAAD